MGSYDQQTVNLFLRHVGPRGEPVPFTISALGGDVCLYPVAEWDRVGRRGREWGLWPIMVLDWLYAAHLAGRLEDIARRFQDAVTGRQRSDMRLISFDEFKRGLPPERVEALAWLTKFGKPGPGIEEPGARDEETDGAAEHLAGRTSARNARRAGGGEDAECPF